MTDQMQQAKQRSQIIVCISVAVFIAAITQTAFYQERQPDTSVSAWTCLLLGGPGVLMVGYIEWLANPLLLYSWISGIRGRQSQAAGVALAATLLIFYFLDRTNIEWPLVERESSSKIVSLGLGYWLWLLSALTMLLGNGRALFDHRKAVDS
jgi:hypothetical protein